MPAPVVEIRGLNEIMARMAAFPGKLNDAIQATMEASLLTVHESVPPYPAEPPDSTYTRTGTLGRTLGSGEGGGNAGGQPDIYEIRKIGSVVTEGRFGTRLGYAPYVIGDNTQAPIHQGRWWTLKQVAEKAQDKILRLWNNMSDQLAKWLDGKGL